METTTTPTGVLSERNMKWYLGGQLLSLTGTMLQTAVLALLVITLDPKNAAFWAGMVWALDLVPGFLLAPFAGILLDRFDKRKVLIITGIFGMLQALSFAYLTYSHQITLLNLSVLALIMGLVNAIDGPGRNAIIKDAIVNKQNVRKASKMFSSLYNLAQVMGPGLAGYLVLYAGFPITFLINSFSFFALVVALANMHLVLRDVKEHPSNSQSVKVLLTQGLKYIISEPTVRLSIILTGLISLFGFFYIPILAVIARDLFHGNAITYSHLAAASGVGSFVGALIIINFNEKISHTKLIVGAMIVLGIALSLLSQTSNIYIGLVLIFMMGFCFMVSFSSVRSSLLHIIKPELTGIVMGFTFTFFYGGMMFGSFLAGYFANIYGCPPVLITGGIILSVIGIFTPFMKGIEKLN